MFIPPYTISDVADLLFIRRVSDERDGAFGVVCPFCGDERGKMNFCNYKDGEIKNTYHCYNCGAQGNMLQLYAALTGITGSDCCKVAYHEIKEKLGLNGTGSFQERRYAIQKREQIRKKAESTVEPADYKKRDQVYRALLSMLSLNELHRKDLQRRGLTDAQICHMKKKGFLSTDPSASESIARKLLSMGYSLSGVPGFFIDQRKNWRIAFFDYNRGYLCPVISQDGFLIGFQIRLDRPFKGMKYSWLTSSGKECGCSSKSPAGFFGAPNVPILYVTEGILKAAIAHELTGKTFLGNPGVAHYRELEVILTEMKDQGLETVMECYDMDKLLNLSCKKDLGEKCDGCEEKNTDGICPEKKQKRDSIRSGCNQLYRICQENHLKCFRVAWDVAEDGTWNGAIKGIDDWQAAARQDEKMTFMEAA